MSGGNYPSFVSGQPNGYSTLGLAINFLPFDHAPQQDPRCGGYCRAQFDPNTNTITLYGFAGASGHLQDWKTIPSGLQSRMLAHEFGHALGLDDDSCSNGIMNVPLGGTESITSDECGTADQMNHVPAEGTTRQGCDSPEDCHVSPIVVNLSDEPYRLTDLDGGVWFDMDGTGSPVKMAWTTTDSEQGFLFLDRNGNGIVDDGLELFGDVTATNGFEALKPFDRPNGEVLFGGNGNGWIDPGDAVWSRLRLWIDSNHDGICQPSEVFTLEQKGVAAIGLNYATSPRRDSAGNLYRYRAALLQRRGRATVVRPVYDVYFASQP
jgi:hypothetical protein